MWDMFTDAEPCLDGRCVAKSDSQKLHAVEKKGIFARRRRRETGM